jgi:uncharacterized membrane protein YvbJ
MFCNQCGAQLSDGSVFCNKCGAAIPANSGSNVQSTRQPSAYQQGARFNEAASTLNPIADEHIIFTIRPTMVFVLIWYAISTLLVIGVAALMGILSSSVLKGVSGMVIFLLFWPLL